VAHGISSATANTPSGRAVKALITRGVVSFTDTDEVGVYTLSTARGDMKLAVNLGDGDESDITPHPLPAPPAQVTAASPPVPIQRELWPLFVLVAAVLLALEGVLYWRRQTGGRLRVPSVTGDQWALATVTPGHANRLVMLTDGRQNAGNALAGAQAAKDARADIFYVPAPLTFTQEVVAEAMVLPQEVKYGEPFQAKVVAWSLKETQARLS